AQPAHDQGDPLAADGLALPVHAGAVAGGGAAVGRGHLLRAQRDRQGGAVAERGQLLGAENLTAKDAKSAKEELSLDSAAPWPEDDRQGIAVAGRGQLHGPAAADGYRGSLAKTNE